MSNIYLPKGLPLLNDHTLRGAVLEYREAVRELGLYSPDSKASEITETIHGIEEALQVMEHELEERGINMDGMSRPKGDHHPLRRSRSNGNPQNRILLT